MGFIQSLHVRQLDEVGPPLMERPTVFPTPVQTQAPTQTQRAPAATETPPPSSTVVQASAAPIISSISNTTSIAAGKTSPAPQPGINVQGSNGTANATPSSNPETAPDMADGNATSSDRSAVIGGSIAGVIIALFLFFLLYKYRRQITSLFRPKPEDPEEPSFVDELERQNTRLSRFEDRCGGTSVSDGRPQTASTVRELQPHYSFATSVPTLAGSPATSQHSLAPSSRRSGEMTLPPPQKPREVRYRLPLYHMEDDSYDNIELDPCERLEPPSLSGSGDAAIIRQGPCRTPSSASARAVALAWWQASGTCESPKARYSYLEAKKSAPTPVVPELRTPSRAEVCDDGEVSVASVSVASSMSGVLMMEEGSSVVGTTRSPSARSDRPSSVFSKRSDSFVSAASSFENYPREERDTAAAGEMEMDNDAYGDEHEDLDFEMLTEGDSTIIAVATTSARSSIQEIDVTSSKSLSRAQTLNGGENSQCMPIHPKDQGPVVQLKVVEAEQTDESSEERERDLEVDEYPSDEYPSDDYQSDEDAGYESSVIEEDYAAVPSTHSGDARKQSIEEPRDREWSPEVLETIRESRELLMSSEQLPTSRELLPIQTETPLQRETLLPEISFEDDKGFDFGFLP
ncbi:hypothetical protein MCOR27_000898 [Pyricularia oryzae]|nr:hypothetical protein MCOR27_000898 [Pyricularia oryzae]KAI6469849.1 hypothetical protein MCOR15_001592 [Pyricularia oryzae]KAI6520033.1 hypothetical protein MCOR05_010935 [Pyricularia oryzae]KAI6532582.1 hypothetical protein MCOR10_002873 [Pyricularia oryzae]KAI6541397.1 hypothetical protein MCOR16_000570 [Pyricularia oryzae]